MPTPAANPATMPASAPRARPNPTPTTLLQSPTLLVAVSFSSVLRHGLRLRTDLVILLTCPLDQLSSLVLTGQRADGRSRQACTARCYPFSASRRPAEPSDQGGEVAQV